MFFERKCTEMRGQQTGKSTKKHRTPKIPPLPSGLEMNILYALFDSITGEIYGLELAEVIKIARGSIFVTLDRMQAKKYIASRYEGEKPRKGMLSTRKRFVSLTPYGQKLVRFWRAAERLWKDLSK